MPPKPAPPPVAKKPHKDDIQPPDDPHKIKKYPIDDVIPPVDWNFGVFLVVGGNLNDVPFVVLLGKAIENAGRSKLLHISEDELMSWSKKAATLPKTRGNGLLKDHGEMLDEAKTLYYDANAEFSIGSRYLARMLKVRILQQHAMDVQERKGVKLRDEPEKKAGRKEGKGDGGDVKDAIPGNFWGDMKLKTRQ